MSPAELPRREQSYYLRCASIPYMDPPASSCEETQAPPWESPWVHSCTEDHVTNTWPLAHIQTTGNYLHEKKKKIPGALSLPNPSVEAIWHVNTVPVTRNGMELHGRPSLVLSCFSQGFWSHWLRWAWVWRSTWVYPYDL